MKLPSLYSPERSEGDGWCWANLQNTHFSGLTRKNPAFERSVLKYVSIKNRILTPSGQKRRVCVNAADRLLPPKQRTHSLCIFQLPHAMKHTNHSYSNRTSPGLSCFLPFTARHQKQVVGLPSLYSPERSEGDGWCWTNLQNTHFSGLTRKNPAFERSVLMYVSIKNRILTQSGPKSRVCVNAADRLLPRHQAPPPFCL